MKGKIFKTVKAALEKAEIKYDIEQDVVFSFGVRCEHANYNVKMLCDEKMEILMTVVGCSMCVPEDKMDRMCRWIVEKNYRLTLGEFKLDTSDGELTFRIACPLDKGAVNEDIVTVAFSNALNTFENSYEEIARALYMTEDDNLKWMMKMAGGAVTDNQESGDESASSCDKRLLN